MICPHCGFNCGEVVDSRETRGTQRRRYECSDCGYRWTTYEISAAEYKGELKIRALQIAVEKANKALERALEDSHGRISQKTTKAERGT